MGILGLIYSWDRQTALMLTLALNFLDFSLVLTHPRMLFSTLPFSFQAGSDGCFALKPLPASSPSFSLFLMSVSHNKNLAHLIPSWPLFLRGPGLTHIYFEKYVNP